MEIDYVHHESVTYGSGFAIKSEVDFVNCTGKITAVKIKTNADRIRMMSDEELAKFLVYTDWCALLCKDPLECIDGECVGFALAWLKKEVSE